MECPYLLNWVLLQRATGKTLPACRLATNLANRIKPHTMTITLRPLYHRGKEVIALCTPYEKALNAAIRKLPGVRWSQTHTVWYAPWGKESYEHIVAVLGPLATIDTQTLRAYLAKRDAVKQTLVPQPQA